MIPGLPPLKVLETITLGSDAATQRIPASGTIADLAPAGSRHLGVIVNGQGAGRTTHRLQLNGDTTDGNYFTARMYGTGLSPSALTSHRFTANGMIFGDMPTASSTASGGAILIPHYANDYGHKAALSIGGENELNVFVCEHRWASDAEVTYATGMTGDGSNMITGTVITLAVVDETYAIAGAEQLLAEGSDAAINAVTLPDVAGDISFIGYLRSAKSATAESWNLNLNGDTTAGNYSHQVFQADGTTASGWSSASSLEIAYHPADSGTANVFGAYLGSISQHADGDNHAHLLTFGGFHETTTHSNIRMYSKRWANTAAVTSLLINPVDGTAEDGTMMSY